MPQQKRNYLTGNKNLANIALLMLTSLTFSPAYALNGVELTAQIRECPTEAGNESAVLASAGLAIASGLVVNLVGQAVDAVTNYLTKEQASTSSAFIALTQDQESSLLNGRKCLYTFANTLPLKNYLDGKMVSVNMINFIRRKKLTPFFSVISFEKDYSSINTESSFYKPRVDSFIYQSFLDNGCPLLRSCNKRDVAISLVITNPRSPSGTLNRAFPLEIVFPNATPQSIDATLSNYPIRKDINGKDVKYMHQDFAWFSHDDTSLSPSNLTFVLTETSKPGAFAKVLSTALKSNKDLITKSVESYVSEKPTTLSEKRTLADSAFEEYKKYALLHQTARTMFDSGLEKTNEYQLMKRRVNLQLQISKAAWSAASVTQKLQELPELP